MRISEQKMTFTIDWEPWFSYEPYSNNWEHWDDQTEEPTYYLLDLLGRHHIKAIWYCLGWLMAKKPQLSEMIQKEGHLIGWHSKYHNSSEKLYEPLPLAVDPSLYRAPGFKGQKRLYSGGFWFRALPYLLSKRLLERSGIFYIHPYDVMLVHPALYNPIQNFKRQIGLKNVRDKLERLCREIEFSSPHTFREPAVS